MPSHHRGMETDVIIRAAGPGDVEQLVDIASRRRDQYERYQPRFWRPSANAVHRQREFFADLLQSNTSVALVAVREARVIGFAVAHYVDPPPVYDSGGKTCMVDDFTVALDADWPRVGPLLLAAVRRMALQRGAVQVVVVTAHLDSVKRSMLQRDGLSLASEWWTGSTDESRPLAGPQPTRPRD